MSAQNHQSYFQLRKLFQHVRALKFVLLGVLLLSFLLAVYLSAKRHPAYRATVILKAKQSQFGFNALGGLASVAGQFVRQQSSPAQTESVLLTSRFVLLPVIKKLRLDIAVEPAYFPVLGKVVKHFYHKHVPARAFLGLSTYAWGGEAIAVSKLSVPKKWLNKKLVLVALRRKEEFSLLSPKGRKLFQAKVGRFAQGSGAKIYVKGLVARPGTHFYVTQYSLQQALLVLQKSLSVKLQDPNSSIITVSYIARHPGVSIKVVNAVARQAHQAAIKEQVQRAGKTLAFLQQQLPKVHKKLMQAEAALSAYRAKSGSIDEQVQYKLLLGQLMQVQQQLQALELQRTSLLQKFTPQHPTVVTMDKKISALKLLLKQKISHLRHLPMSDKTALKLQRTVAAESQLYLLLLNSQQQMQVLKAGILGNLQVLSYASMPPLLIPAKKPLLFFGIIFIGILLDCLIVYFRMVLHGHYIAPTSVKDKFALNVSAIVPYSSDQGRLVRAREQLSTRYADYVLANQYPEDLALESLRSLRSSLQLALLDADKPIIGINGLAPMVGKSFVSANLAVLFAKLGKRVLLLDADLRKGHLHHAFKLGAKHGLSEYLEGKADYDSIKHVMDEHLTIIPRGKIASNTTDLLHSERFPELLDKLAAEYDLVVMDSAPFLVIADGLLVARQAAVNLLVMGMEMHQEDELKQGLQKLKAAEVKLHGVVFNFHTKSSFAAYKTDHVAGYSYRHHYKVKK